MTNDKYTGSDCPRICHLSLVIGHLSFVIFKKLLALPRPCSFQYSTGQVPRVRSEIIQSTGSVNTMLGEAASLARESRERLFPRKHDDGFTRSPLSSGTTQPVAATPKSAATNHTHFLRVIRE